MICKNCRKTYEPRSQSGIISANGKNQRRIDPCCPNPEPLIIKCKECDKELIQSRGFWFHDVDKTLACSNPELNAYKGVSKDVAR